MKKNILSLFLVIIVFIACSTKKVETIYSSTEDKLSTSNSLKKFHSIVYYPDEIKLDFPGYVIGLEKSPRKNILKDGDLKLNTQNKSAGVLSDIKRLKNESKLLYISHIFKYEKVEKPIYNLFNERMALESILTHKPIYNLYDKKTAEEDISRAFIKSWDALERLKKEIKNEIKNHDSILILTMGWNTPQEEAIRNFNSIYNNLKNVGGENFNPLVLGVTWPSDWESSFIPDFLVKLASFPNKSNDADEVGISWLGALIHNTLNKIDKPIIAIGHSFGARATSMAAFEGNVIYKDKPYIKRNIEALISLQGAYSMNRFFGDGIEDILYDRKETKVAVTSSIYDLAMNSAPWAPYVGSNKSYEKYCKDIDITGLNCVEYMERDNINLSKEFEEGEILYINSNSIIKNNVYNSGGGAHSDIYDKEMGKLLWNLIKDIK